MPDPRDENHLAYCSGVCCLASLKQSTYLREKNPNAQAFIYFIDIRAQGKLEDFFVKVKQDEKLSLIKSKIALITEDPVTKNLILEGEDTQVRRTDPGNRGHGRFGHGHGTGHGNRQGPGCGRLRRLWVYRFRSGPKRYLWGRLYQAAGGCGRCGPGCHRGGAPGYSICGEEVNSNG